MVCNLRTREGVPETVYNQWVQAPDFVGAESLFAKVPTVAAPRRLVALRWAKLKNPLRGFFHSCPLYSKAH